MNAAFTFHFPDQPWLDGGNGRTDKTREPMGCLGDQGWYPLSVILWAFGWELPEKVEATSTTLNKVDTIVACSGTLYFKDGRVATFNCGCTSAHRSQYEIVCENGTVRVEDLVGGQGRSGDFSAYFVPYVGSGKYVKGDVMGKDTVVDVEESDHVDALVEDFSACVNAIKAGGKPDLSWPKRSLAVHTVMSAIFESCSDGGKVVPVVASENFVKPIIVLGSSGNVGKATLAALSAAGVPAKAGVRDPSPDNPKNAPLLAMSGITLAQADMSKPETLAPAIAEGSTVFVATPGHIDRTALTNAAISAAVAAKAGHIVVLSLPVVTVAKKTIFGDQFKSIEAAVKSSGIPFTLVRLPMFMDNALGQPIKDMSSVFMPVVADQDMSSISVKDIGCGFANVLQAPEKYAGRTLNLAGVTTNFTATVAAYSKVLGRTINYTQVPPEAAKASMMGAGWPEWQVDGVLELMALINEKDPSGLIPKVDDDTFEVLGKPADSPEVFMEGFKQMFAKPRVALVTGANKGLGQESCKQLAAAGCHVYLAARKTEAAEAAAVAIVSAGTIIPIKMDINSSEDIQAAVKAISDAHGRLDILINNAGSCFDQPNFMATSGLTISREELMNSFDVNVCRQVEVVQAFADLLKAAPNGRIVQQSSILGSMTNQVNPEVGANLGKSLGYCASKAALNMTTVMLAAAFEGTNVKINSSHPGWVKTESGGGDISPHQLDVPTGASTAVGLALDSAKDSPTGTFSHQGTPMDW